MGRRRRGPLGSLARRAPVYACGQGCYVTSRDRALLAVPLGSAQTLDRVRSGNVAGRLAELLLAFAEAAMVALLRRVRKGLFALAEAAEFVLLGVLIGVSLALCEGPASLLGSARRSEV